MPSIADLLNSYVAWFQSTYFPSMAVALFVITLIGTRPVNINPHEDHSFWRVAAIKLRVLSLGLAFLLFVSPVAIGLIVAAWGWGHGNVNPPLETYLQLLENTAAKAWPFPLIGLLTGVLFNWTVRRKVRAWTSNLKRRLLIRPSGDQLSDIRTAGAALAPKTFDPVTYYQEGQMFYGLDEDNQPIYDEDEIWRARHQRFVGPTQVGKGVILGVQLDQAIRKGWTVVFVDPKPDRHARAIMHAAAENTGRRFVELDLRPQGRGYYGPFYGGSPRDRRARLLLALGLADTGTDADFYKAGEREAIDALFDHWDGTLDNLLELLEQPEVREVVTRSRNAIKELLAVSTFDTTPRRPSFSVERSLLEDAVVYVRGDMDDPVITRITTCLVMELVQEIKRLHAQRTTHCFLAIDEVAFLVSERLADALATIAGFDANIALAYQSEGDLINLKDRTLDGRAISQRIRANCKTTLYYQASDAQTAEIMAEESGTVQKSVVFTERVERGADLVDEWQGDKMMRRETEALISPNEARMLPERVGVLYRPNQLASMVYTAWVNVDLAQAEEPAPKTETKTKERSDKPRRKHPSQHPKKAKRPPLSVVEIQEIIDRHPPFDL